MAEVGPLAFDERLKYSLDGGESVFLLFTSDEHPRFLY